VNLYGRIHTSVLKLTFLTGDIAFGFNAVGKEQKYIADSCEQGNEPLGSVKCRVFLHRF
jgi:hypothetical protein